MTNEQFHKLRLDVAALLESAGFQNVKINMSLSAPAPTYDLSSTGVGSFRRPDMMRLELNASATVGEYEVLLEEVADA